VLFKRKAEAEKLEQSRQILKTFIMKKKNLKSLKLNKKSISNLHRIVGGNESVLPSHTDMIRCFGVQNTEKTPCDEKLSDTMYKLHSFHNDNDCDTNDDCPVFFK